MAKKAKKRGVKPGTKRGSYNKNVTFTPIKHLTLCEQLEDAITRLENRVSDNIARINSLM